MAFKQTFRPFLSNLLQEVVDQSLADGVISQEESLLLTQIEIDIRDFEKECAIHLDQKQKQEKETQEKNRAKIPSKKATDMKSQNETFQQKLIQSVKKLALQDGEISQDEAAIIAKIENYFARKK
jgi:tellurite resistance protein